VIGRLLEGTRPSVANLRHRWPKWAIVGYNFDPEIDHATDTTLKREKIGKFHNFIHKIVEIQNLRFQVAIAGVTWWPEEIPLATFEGDSHKYMWRSGPPLLPKKETSA